MFFRLLLESFRRQRRRKLLAGVAILLGTTAVTAMLAIATTIGDRIHQELAVYGANLLVTPKAEALSVKVGGVDIRPATGNSYLKESDLNKLRTIFWANNITAISPELSIRGSLSRNGLLPLVGQTDLAVEGFLPDVPIKGMWFNHPSGSSSTGAPQLHPWWKLQGAWPRSSANAGLPFEVLLGSNLAKRISAKVGDNLFALVGSRPVSGRLPELRVVGIVGTGNDTDDSMLLPLSDAQRLNNTPDAISRIEVSAKTRPEDAFARKDPETLSPRQRDLWYCRPYANSIAYQIREAIPGADAQQVRQVEQSEGNILNRIGGLMGLVSAAALLAAGFAVSAAMATAILERRGEIGLMRSLGASKGAIATLFYVETGILALLSGTLGYLAGSGLAAWLGARIFAAADGSHGPSIGPILNPVLLPVVLGMALLVAIAGSTPAIRSALRLDPTTVLRADA